jgi:putative ABC transport system permease protein
MLPALIGIVLGLMGAYFVTKVMSGMLYQVKPRDPEVFLFASGVLILVALLAAFIPAKRASRIDPVDALRLE